MARGADHRSCVVLPCREAAAVLRFQLHRHKRRTVPQAARIVLIARSLVDPHLAAERGIDRLQAHAIGLLHAVAASFAHPLVDHQARCSGSARISAGPPVTLLGRALLVIENHRHAFDGGGLAHGVVQFQPVADVRIRRPLRVFRILILRTIRKSCGHPSLAACG